MSIDLPIGPIMVDLEGTALSAAEKEKIAHPNTGAVILFSRNYAEPGQITTLIDEIRSARKGPLLIAVDQEGGRVQRFQSGFTRLPPASIYARCRDAAESAYSAGWLMAAELLAVGVDFSFAPVLDVDCGVSEIIGDRSFSADPANAAALAGDFRKGMNAAGMAAVGKHFPGHGAVAADSHLALPVDERELDALRKNDLIPFKQLIAQGLEGIMPAHVVFPQVDRLPAGYSPIWIRRILREELKFDGAVFSDDLSMAGAAVAGDFTERAVLAIEAGCDMALICNNPTAAEQVLDNLPVKNNSAREMRLQNMRGKPKMNRRQLMQSEHWTRIAGRINKLVKVLT
ncbi:MAG: beta-N-acetylhexosaminidase [Gammaproteobacteria bacterium]